MVLLFAFQRTVVQTECCFAYAASLSKQIREKKKELQQLGVPFPDPVTFQAINMTELQTSIDRTKIIMSKVTQLKPFNVEFFLRVRLGTYFYATIF